MLELETRIGMLREQVEINGWRGVALLDEAQFTNGDIESACYVTPTQLHNWVSRGWIKLSAATPGKGRRRLYSGQDAIAIAVAAALQPFGMMQVADQLVRMNQVNGRALRLLTDPLFEPYYALAIVPEPGGDDWLYIPMTPRSGEPQSPTPSFVLLDVDRLIVETLENVLLVMDGKSVPARNFPKKPTFEEGEDEFLAFTGGAYRDDEGRRVYRGLTVEESFDWDDLKNRNLAARVSDEVAELTHEESGRSVEYFRRNELARLNWLRDTAEQRQADASQK